MKAQNLNAAAHDEVLRLQVEAQTRVTRESSPEAVRARALRKLNDLEIRVKREQLARLRAQLQVKAAAAPKGLTDNKIEELTQMVRRLRRSLLDV